MNASSGHVYLVGAGPGDPGLLTQRGAELLRRADVVVYDRLVVEELLDLAPPHAERIDAGKAPGDATMSQHEINAALVDRALRGSLVVRLKGGDPFVFGRGSEELAACRDAGVPCDVVPGVTSGIAAAAAVGIPVTARGVARSFAVVTARSGEGFATAVPDYPALARIDTVVVLMGRECLREITDRLIAAGKDPSTPAALIGRATWPEQRHVVADLSSISDAADAAQIAAPAVLVVGPTAAWAQRDTAAIRSALHGMRILVTRPRTASRDLVQTLRDRGADVINCPLIRIAYPAPTPIAPDLRSFDWIVLTSLHGVRGFWRSIEASGLDARALANIRIAAVGPKTAAELWAAARIRADLIPGEFRAAALRRSLASVVTVGTRVLFPCGTLARDEIAMGLREFGADVTEFVVYDTLPLGPRDAELARIREGVDAIVLYSPSAARSLAEHRLVHAGSTIVCVGPTTADEVRNLGLGDPLVATTYGDDGVLAVLESLGAAASGGAY